MAQCHALTFLLERLWHDATASLFCWKDFGTMPRPHFFVGRALANCHGLIFLSEELWHGATASLFCRKGCGMVPRAYFFFGKALAQCRGLTFLSERLWHGATASQNFPTPFVCATRVVRNAGKHSSARHGFTERSGSVCTMYTALFFLRAVTIIPRHSIANIIKSLSFRSEASPPASPTGSFWRG